MRFRIWAWIETSRAETGSSATISSRVEGEGPGQADALALAAGELVRVELDRVGAQPDLVQERRRPSRLRSAALPIPWTTRGSRRIVPTRIRGSSEA